MNPKVKIAVVGSGPAGLSCAARAAENDVSHVLFEAEPQLSTTIYRYQKGKHVMAEPAVLPLRAAVGFQAGKREIILQKWSDDLSQRKVNVRFRSAVQKISGEKGNFEIQTAAGETWQAEHVVLCIGLQGNIRKLGVPGEDLEMVQYQLDDAGAFKGETIVVVGAGDAAIENALALADAGNRVVILNRTEEFARAKQGNLDLILEAIREGGIECRYGTSAVRVEEVPTEGKRGRFVVLGPQGEGVIACDRIIARLGAIPPRKLVENVLRTRAMPGQQDHAVKPEICGFAYEMQFITVLRGEQGLGRLFSHLLQYRVLPFGSEARNVGGAGIGLQPLRDHCCNPLEHVRVFHE